MKPLRTLIAAFAVLCCAAAAAANPLRIGIAAEPYPPFTIKQSNGQWSGFEVELVRKLCQRLKQNCQITEVSWDGIIPALNSKKIDVIFNSMSITPEREKVIAFSLPYYYTASEFVGPKGQKTVLSPAGLKGKTLGVQSATTNANFLKKYYGAGSAIRYYNTQDELNADLVAGRVDLMLLDALAASDFLGGKDGAGLESKGLAPKDPLFGPGIGAGLRKADVALKQQFDQAILQLRADGSFDAIQKKYFKVNISPDAK
ncbi:MULTISPECIES: transporter substrate-binding domain-containing protein [Chromobacterium]|uniref:Amino acid ABC transporter substrate-binding protein n=1 Tax=Chromobacterium haemolyticum TaxID=394935 RepID=A0A1W0CGW8_9NEIS|nr:MULTISPECIES: transporter substrate-binding domain-containing protein [Chromobacterium]OQS33993.1 amino acid ABC transporter substrate-binding protein [Chromobacterium haemolyticum]QOZ85017.1 amino acid ABC transporter substrate-binding protein [Chromobacterium sp. Rain0013]WON85224.1 transporter substrate-binding domain-containing protein [Chromobacterium haemolyticum]